MRPTIYTNPPQERNFSRTFFKPEDFEYAKFCVLNWAENILKEELLENDDITIIG